MKEDLVFLMKLVAMPCGMLVSAGLLRGSPVAAVILGAIIGTIDFPSAPRPIYIDPAFRPLPTTLLKARVTLVVVFGGSLLICLSALWLTQNLPIRLNENVQAVFLYISGSICIYFIRSFANAKKSTDEYNAWLSSMSRGRVNSPG